MRRGCVALVWRWLALCLLAVAVGGSPAFGRGPAEPAVTVAQLPPEARATLALIRDGGPFPYRKDGSVFGNRERLLPRQPRGYYTEYTVRTPGERDRGARRLVVGGEPRRLAEVWYTSDHYASFRRVVDAR